MKQKTNKESDEFGNNLSRCYYTINIQGKTNELTSELVIW